MEFTLKSKIARYWNSPGLGLVLLLMALMIGTIFRYAGFFVTDEGDKFAIGLQLTRGAVLYRDVFTHHFPFTFFWVAAVLRLAPSVKAVRLSLLLYQMVAFWLTAWLTRTYALTGLAALVWAVIGHLFFANMAIYNSFVGPALLVIFGLTLALLLKRIVFGAKEILALGLCAAIAMLSDPVSIFPISVALFAILLAPAGLRNTPRIGMVIGAVFALFGIYLALTGSLPNFYQDVIVFNSQVYTKYYGSSLSNLRLLPDLLFKGLWIFDFRRSQLPDWTIRLGDTPHWILYWTGWFVYRLAVIACAGELLLRKKWLASAFIYLFTATILIRGDAFFRQITLVMVALLCAAWFIAGQLHGFEKDDRDGHWLTSKWSSKWPAVLAKTAISITILGLMAWLVFLTVSYAWNNPNLLSYFDRFGYYETRKAEIEQVICNQPARLGYYPTDAMVYFYTGYPPVSKYVYLYPWVAEVGLDDILSSLQAGSAVVFVDKATDVWGYPTREYLAKLISYLDSNYIYRQGFYLSPDLAANCPPSDSP